MSGGFEYNLTTESEYEEMKQRNMELMDENYNLKKTLESMIKVNNQLSDTIEQFNNSALANPHLLTTLHQSTNSTINHNKYTENTSADHTTCHKMLANLEEQIEYFKGLAYEKINNQDNSQIIHALEGLIDSFKQTQKFYEDQITAISEEIDNYKSEWDGKIFKMQQTYFQKTRVLEEIIKQLRKKQQIVSIIEKKVIQEPIKGGPRKILKKYSQIETSSQRKMPNHHTQPLDMAKQKIQKTETISKQVDDLKQRQKKLNDQIKQKDHTIAVYTELLVKLRKKLSQKF